MKKIYLITLIFALLLTACSVEKPLVVEEPPVETDEQMVYEPIDVSALPGNVQNQVDALKQHRGYYVIETDEGPLLFIGLGLKPSGGFDILPVSTVEDGNQWVIEVFEREPAEDEMVTQALTYPFILMPLTSELSAYQIINQEGIAFDPIDLTEESLLTLVGAYVGQIDGNSIEVTVDDGFMVFRNYLMNEWVLGLESGDLVEITYKETEEGQYQLIELKRTE